jgi:phosphonate transport system substrate-binding protein
MTVPVRRLAAACGLLVATVLPAAADDCRNHGQLDARYCDENGDLVADAPTDPAKWKDPSTLVFSFTPIEDPAVYAKVFRPFTDYLAGCTGKRVVYYAVPTNKDEIDAMRAGRLHVAGFSSGTTGFAVNIAGAVPFAARGTEKGPRGHHLIAIVRADSPYRTLRDLKGKRVAHTSPSSNSGNLAPRALFAHEGLAPEQDYTPIMSGGHDRSALGVASGEYDMAAVSSDVLERMIARGIVKASDFRIIYRSAMFPTTSYAYAYDLKPELAKKITACFFAYRFPAAMKKEFEGDDHFVPIGYKEQWAVVRHVAEDTGTPYTRAAYDAESKRELDAFAKKEQQQVRKNPGAGN